MKTSNIKKFETKEYYNSKLENELKNKPIKPLRNWGISAEKEKEVFETFGNYYTDFFEEKNTSTTMFVDTSDFRTTKTVFITTDLVVPAGKTTGILFDPFSEENVLTSYNFGTMFSLTQLTNFKSRLQSFAKFKVVQALFKIKQVSILSLADGYGTVLDAVMTPSTFDPLLQGLNPLNIANSQKFKLDTIDGRVGIKACILGNPYDDWKSVNSPIVLERPSIYTVGVYLQDFPSGTKYTIHDNSATFFDSNGRVITEIVESGNVNILLTPAVKAEFTELTYVQIPQNGMRLWVKITPPNQSVTFKLMYKVALEVIPGPTLLEDVQTFCPPFNYNTQRIFSSIYNNYQCLTPYEKTLLYAASNILFKLIKEKNKIKEENDLKNKQIGDEKEGKKEIVKGNKEDKKRKEKKRIICYASGNDNALIAEMIRKKLYKINKAEKVEAFVPQYIKEATEFVGENVGKMSGSNDYARMLRNSTTNTPPTNWQFFPVIDNNETVSSAIVAMKNENEGSKYVKLNLMNADDQKYESLMYYNDGDLEEPEDFVKYIGQLAVNLNAVYYANFPPVFTIRFFAAGKIADRSYGAAVMALFMNAYPGQFMTGTILTTQEKKNKKIDEDLIQFEYMDAELLKAKSDIATNQCPLLAPFNETNSGPYMVSGLMGEVLNEKIYTFRNTTEFILFLYLTPSVKNQKQNPATVLQNEIGNYLSNLNPTIVKKFLYLRNFAPIQSVASFLNDSEYKLKMPPNTYSKCRTCNFSNIAYFGQKEKKYIDIDDVVRQDPNFLIQHKVPYFEYKGNNYYYIPSIISYLPVKMRKYTTEEIKQLKNKNDSLLQEISEEEMKDILKKYLEENPYDKNMDKELKQQIQKSKVKISASQYLGKYKEMLNTLKKIVVDFQEYMAFIRTGKKNYSSYPQHLGVIDVKTTVHNDDVAKVKANPKFKKFEKLADSFAAGEFAYLITEAGLPSKTTIPRNISKNMEHYLERFNLLKTELDKIPDVVQSEKDKKETISTRKKKKKEEISDDEINESEEESESEETLIGDNKKINIQNMTDNEIEELLKIGMEAKSKIKGNKNQ